MKLLKGIFRPFTTLGKWFIHMSLIKKVIVLIILGAAFYGVYYYISTQNNKSAVTTDTVKIGTITDEVSESGNVQSNQVNIYSSTNGVINEIFVKNGDEVKQGQKLFTVKSTATSDEKTKAYASYQSAQASLNIAYSNLRSAQASLDNVLDEVQGNDDDENFDQKETRTKAEVSKDNAYDSVTTAQSNLTSAQIAYNATQDSTALAPIAGTVANVGYSSGNNVSALSGTGTTASGTPVLILGTIKDYEVKIQINEVDINKIQVAQPASITFDAIKDSTFNGEVTRVDDYGTDNSGVITYNVYVKVVNPEDQLKPSMSAIVTIETEKHENALLVPNSAVKPYKGGKAIQVKDPSAPSNQLKYIQVKTGIKDATQTEILEGVTEGMEVVTSTTAKIEDSGGGGFGPGG